MTITITTMLYIQYILLGITLLGASISIALLVKVLVDRWHMINSDKEE